MCWSSRKPDKFLRVIAPDYIPQVIKAEVLQKKQFTHSGGQVQREIDVGGGFDISEEFH